MFFVVRLLVFSMLATESSTLPLKQKFQGPYFGDVSYLDYLTAWCTEYRTKKTEFFLVEGFEHLWHSEQSKPSLIGQHLERIDCLHYHYLNVSPGLLITTLSNNKFRHQHSLVVFDFTAHTKPSQKDFDQLIHVLGHVYHECRRCFPFQVVFDVRTVRLLEWTEQVLSWTRRSFRMIVLPLSENLARNVTIILRPLLDGCRLWQGAMIPTKKVHFRQLSQHYNLCNFRNATLRIVVNDHIPNCLVKKVIEGGRQVTRLEKSLELHVLVALARTFRFRYELLHANQNYGNEVNGTWTGLIGMVFNEVLLSLVMIIILSLEMSSPDRRCWHVWPGARWWA